MADDIGSAIYSILAAHAGTSALVDSRIYPDRRPQNPTYPLITYEHDDEESVAHMGGMSGLARAFFTVYAWAETRLQATALAKQIRLALAKYTGTANSVVIRDIRIGGRDTAVSKADDGSDTSIYWDERQFEAWYCQDTS